MGACVPPLLVASIGIEGVIIHGAQGARSLTVLLLAPTPGEPSA
jgi:hypothetical protein